MVRPISRITLELTIIWNQTDQAGAALQACELLEQRKAWYCRNSESYQAKIRIPVNGVMEKAENSGMTKNMDEWINFLEETIRCLECHGKTEKDVRWVGRGFGVVAGHWLYPEPYKTTWEDFRSKADFCYDYNYGIEYIPLDLILVGEDFWLEREEYDGLEHWAYRTMPTEPAVTRELDLSDAMEEIERSRKKAEEWAKLPPMDWDDLFEEDE